MNAGWNNKLCCLYNVRMYRRCTFFPIIFHYCTPIIIRCKFLPWQIGIYGMDITCDSAAWWYYIIILPIIYKRSETLVRVYNLNVTFTWIEFEISEKSDQLKFMLEKTLYLGACKYFKSSSVNAVILIIILHEIHVF